MRASITETYLDLIFFEAKNQLQMDTPLSSQEIVDWTRRYTYATWRQQKGWTPLHVVDAKAATLRTRVESDISTSRRS